MKVAAAASISQAVEWACDVYIVQRGVGEPWRMTPDPVELVRTGRLYTLSWGRAGIHLRRIELPPYSRLCVQQLARGGWRHMDQHERQGSAALAMPPPSQPLP